MQEQRPQLTLHRGFEDYGQYTWSAFVNKLELRLRLGNYPYTAAAGLPLKGPKGKIPWVELQYKDGTKLSLGDSDLIVKQLVKDGHLDELPSRADPHTRAQDVMMRSMLEDRLYFFDQREKWFDHFYLERDKILWPFSYPMNIVVGSIVYRIMSVSYTHLTLPTNREV